MRTTILIGCFALLLPACDEQGLMAGAGAADALTSVGAEIAAVETEVQGADGPSHPVEVRWDDLVAAETTSADGLALTVTNKSSATYSVSTVLTCRGLINKAADVDLGSRDLAPGESARFALAAKEIPIQTTTGFAQVRAELSLTRETGAGVSTRRMITPPIYYRHGAGYEGLSILDDDALLDEHGGAVVGGAMTASDSGAVLGRIADGEGGYAEVKAMDEAFASKTNGHIAGWETGMSISVGADGAETEVSE